MIKFVLRTASTLENATAASSEHFVVRRSARSSTETLRSLHAPTPENLPQIYLILYSPEGSSGEFAIS